MSQKCWNEVQGQYKKDYVCTKGMVKTLKVFLVIGKINEGWAEK